MKPSIIERAYELASSGQFSTLERLERALAKEGYDAAHLHLRGRTIRKELNAPLRDLGGSVGPTIIERAFELASSGMFNRIDRIERALTKEGFESAHLHLSGSALRSDLSRRMKTANKRSA